MDASTTVSLVIAIGAIITSILAYIRGRKADDAKNESTQATTAVEGFGALTKYLQEEISRLNKEVEHCREESKQRAESDRYEINVLRQEVRRLGGNV